MAGTTQEDANTARIAGEYWSESGSPPRSSPQPVTRSTGELVFPTADWMGDLARTIEAEIIPRLMLAHGGQDPSAPAIGCEDKAPSSPEVVEFANLVLAQDARVARTWVEAVRARGASPETIFLELLAPRDDWASFGRPTCATSPRSRSVCGAFSRWSTSWRRASAMTLSSRPVAGVSCCRRRPVTSTRSGC